MAKFIKLTDIRYGEFALNIETIEFLRPIKNGGTELVTITHHTKYTVKESMDDILDMANDMVVWDIPMFTTTEFACEEVAGETTP